MHKYKYILWPDRHLHVTHGECVLGQKQKEKNKTGGKMRPPRFIYAWSEANLLHTHQTIEKVAA